MTAKYIPYLNCHNTLVCLFHFQKDLWDRLLGICNQRLHTLMSEKILKCLKCLFKSMFSCYNFCLIPHLWWFFSVLELSSWEVWGKKETIYAAITFVFFSLLRKICCMVTFVLDGSTSSLYPNIWWMLHDTQVTRHSDDDIWLLKITHHFSRT